MTYESIFSCSVVTELLLTLRRVECITKRILVTSPVSLKGGARIFINSLHPWPPSIFCFLGSMLFVSQLISLQGPCPAFDMCVLLPLLSIGLEPEGRGQTWAFLQQTTITTFREFVKPELRRKEPNLFNIAWGAAFFFFCQSCAKRHPVCCF